MHSKKSRISHYSPSICQVVTLAPFLLVSILSSCGSCVVQGRCTGVTSRVACEEMEGRWNIGECNEASTAPNNTVDQQYNHYQDPFPR